MTGRHYLTQHSRKAMLLWIALQIGCTAAPSVRHAGLFNILDYGATGNGKTLATRAIQQAVDACAEAGGGKVIIPPGKYLTTPIFLRSNVHVEVMAGATLLGSTAISDHPGIQGRYAGMELEIYASMFTGHDLENVSITGRGTLDGQGEVWWEAHRSDGRKEEGEKKILAYSRPRMINLYRSRNILIQGVTIVNSPSWTVHLVECEDVVVDGIAIINPEDGPNTDGVNPESCRNVRIANCFFDTGDDCITLKSGRDEEGRRMGKPTENVTITNCVMYKGHGAIVIGSEMSGGVRNVTASNIVCVGTDRAVRIKSTRGRGGVVENIRFTNFVIDNVREPIYITTYYTKTDPEPVSERTPIFRDIAISHFTIKNSPVTALIYGLPEMPIQGLRISDVVADTKKGIICESANGVELHDVEVNVTEGAPFSFTDCEDLELDGVKSTRPLRNQPIVRLENVTNAFIHNSRAYPGTGDFLELRGESTRDIFLAGNQLSAAQKTYTLKQGVRKTAVVEQ